MFRLVTRVIAVGLLLVTLGGAQTTPPAAPAGSGAKASGSEPAAAPGQPSKETVEAYLQQMFGYDPSLSWTIGTIRPAPAQGLSEVIMLVMTPQGPQRTTFYITADGKYMIAGDLMPFGAKPFAPMRELLDKGITGPARGPADAPVTIVEFSDLQCPRCKETQPILEKLLVDEPNVRFVFQNFPIPAHEWAAKAAAYADCVGRASNEAFWKFIHNAYEAQADISAANADEKLTALADGAGLKGADIAICAGKPETTDRVEKSVAFGRSIEVNGTPTIFMNGRRMTNFAALPYDGLKRMVEFYGKQPK